MVFSLIHNGIYTKLYCFYVVSTYLFLFVLLLHVFQLYRSGQFYWLSKPRGNHRPAASLSQTLSYNVASTPRLGGI